MRDVVRDLVPEPIMNRGKMGFPVPIGRWLAGPFEGLVDEFVLSARARDRGYFEGSELDRLSREHRGGRIDHADRLWLLINLEIWQRLFVDGEPMEGIQSAGGSSSSPAEPSVPEAQLVAVK
jgi:asparagine synthase (glutamine-hydrolysing)